MLTRLEFSRDPQAMFSHIDECWREACAGRSMPRRPEIGPSRLGRALPFVALLDVIPGDPVDFRYRLIGQHVVVNTGQNLTGKRSLELPATTPGSRPVYSAYARCVETRAPVSVNLEILNMNGTKRRMDMSVWPLGGDETVDAILGAAFFYE